MASVKGSWFSGLNEAFVGVQANLRGGEMTLPMTCSV